MATALAMCPVCWKSFSVSEIHLHANSCADKAEQQAASSSSSSASASASSAPSSPSQARSSAAVAVPTHYTSASIEVPAASPPSNILQSTSPSQQQPPRGAVATIAAFLRFGVGGASTTTNPTATSLSPSGAALLASSPPANPSSRNTIIPSSDLDESDLDDWMMMGDEASRAQGAGRSRDDSPSISGAIDDWISISSESHRRTDVRTQSVVHDFRDLGSMEGYARDTLV